MVTAPAAWAVLCTHPAARGARECTHDTAITNLSKTHCVPRDADGMRAVR